MWITISLKLIQKRLGSILNEIVYTEDYVRNCMQKWVGNFLERNPNTKMTDIINTLELKSSSHLSKVLKGQRKPSIELVEKLWRTTSGAWYEYLRCTMVLSNEDETLPKYESDSFLKEIIWSEKIERDINIFLGSSNATYENMPFFMSALQNIYNRFNEKILYTGTSVTFVTSRIPHKIYIDLQAMAKIAEIFAKHDTKGAPNYVVLFHIIRKTNLR